MLPIRGLSTNPWQYRYIKKRSVRMSEDKDKLLQEFVEKRDVEKDKLFKMMLNNKNQAEVKEQFKEFEKAHKDAIEAYKNAS